VREACRGDSARSLRRSASRNDSPNIKGRWYNDSTTRSNRTATPSALAAPQGQKNVLKACGQVVGADGLIQERQAELLPAIADTRNCPIPPFGELPENQIQTPQ